jgi:hypothetical protein
MSSVQEVRQHCGLRVCHDCGAMPGEYHQRGCDVERCPRCGGQMLTCLACGCAESEKGEPWPPPLDDRMAWTGKWPGETQCEEFGWYVKQNPAGGGSIPCKPHEAGALPDINRLYTDAEWDRREKTFVRTTLTEAMAEMERRGIFVNRGSFFTREEVVEFFTQRAVRCLDGGEPALGYAFYAYLAKRKKKRGKNFSLHFGQLTHPVSGPVGPCAAEVGKVVTDCLRQQGMKCRWKGDPERPIRIITRSISIL